MAGGGGILINPDGNIEDMYARSLGWRTNNQVEAYGLLFGMNMAITEGIKKPQILGESMIIINHMRNNTPTNNTL